jgi:hypothetical protein
MWCGGRSRHEEPGTAVLAMAVGGLFVIFGVAETIRALTDDDDDWWWLYWFGALVGGGAMILLGRSLLSTPPRLFVCLVGVGSLVAANATLWTLVLPTAALAVVALTILKARHAAGQRPRPGLSPGHPPTASRR